MLDIGIALGAVFISTFLIWWIGGKINGTVTTIDRLRSDEALRTSLLTYLAELKANQEKTKPYVPIIQGLLPSRDTVIGLSNRLGSLAAQNNLSGFSFTFGTEKPGTASEAGNIAFTLSTAGSSDDLLRFLKVMEALKGYFIKVNSLDLTSKEKVGYFLSMSGITYIR